MRNSLCIFLLVLIFFRATGDETFATESNAPTVSPELLEAKLAEIKERPGVADETRSQLSGLYQQALNDLKKAAGDAVRTAALLETVRTAPEQIRLLRDQEKTPEPAMKAGRST